MHAELTGIDTFAWIQLWSSPQPLALHSKIEIWRSQQSCRPPVLQMAILINVLSLTRATLLPGEFQSV